MRQANGVRTHACGMSTMPRCGPMVLVAWQVLHLYGMFGVGCAMHLSLPQQEANSVPGRFAHMPITPESFVSLDMTDVPDG